MSTLRTLLLLLFCSISSITTAQQYLGFKVGAINSNSDFNFGIGNYEIADGSKTTLFISLFSEHEVNQYYSFTPNVHFAQAGNTVYDKDSTNYTSFTNRIDYIGVGLLNKIKLFSNEYEVYGLVGPQFRLSFGGIVGRGFSKGAAQKIDYEDINLKISDINIRTGVGLSKVNKNYKIILEWVYDVSFFDINSKSLFIHRNYKSTGLLIGLAFKLNRENQLDN